MTKEESKIINQARNILSKQLKQPGEAITSPQTANDFLKLKLATKEHEVFAVLFLDSRHRVIAYEEMFRGTINGASVHIREVAKRALELNAAALILAHNHPSGVADPSDADRRLTRNIDDALRLFDIRTLDHIIVGGTTTCSLSERGMM